MVRMCRLAPHRAVAAICAGRQPQPDLGVVIVPRPTTGRALLLAGPVPRGQRSAGRGSARGGGCAAPAPREALKQRGPAACAALRRPRPAAATADQYSQDSGTIMYRNVCTAVLSGATRPIDLAAVCVCVCVCVCVSGFISRYDTKLTEYDYCGDGGGGSCRMISAAAAAAAVTPVSSSQGQRWRPAPGGLRQQDAPRRWALATALHAVWWQGTQFCSHATGVVFFRLQHAIFAYWSLRPVTHGYSCVTGRMGSRARL
jgi:hypothetical protein